MIRSYSFQNPRAFPMACATFETTAQKTLGTLACRDIWWWSFRWNASLVAWFKDSRVTQKSVPVGRVGRSIGRESCWSVGSLKLIKIISFGRNSFVQRPHLNVKNYICQT